MRWFHKDECRDEAFSSSRESHGLGLRIHYEFSDDSERASWRETGSVDLRPDDTRLRGPIRIEITGTLDAETVPEFEAAMAPLRHGRRLKAPGLCLNLDLSGVDEIDCAGVATLMTLAGCALRSGGDLQIEAISSRAREVVELCCPEITEGAADAVASRTASPEVTRSTRETTPVRPMRPAPQPAQRRSTHTSAPRRRVSPSRAQPPSESLSTEESEAADRP